MSVKAGWSAPRDFIMVPIAMLQELSPVDAIVLSRIMYRLDGRDAYERDGFWWWRASITSIAADTGLTPRMVRTVMDRLRENGYVASDTHQIAGIHDQTLSWRLVTDEDNSSEPSTQAVDVTSRRRIPSQEPRRNTSNVPLYQTSLETERDKSLSHAREDDPVTDHPSCRSTTVALLDPSTTTTVEDEFARAWKAWPKKDSRMTSEARFRRLVRNRRFTATDLADLIIRWAHAYQLEGRERQFIPGLAVWLNQERWTGDMPAPQEPARPQRHTAVASMLALTAHLDQEAERYGHPTDRPALDAGDDHRPSGAHRG